MTSHIYDWADDRFLRIFLIGAGDLDQKPLNRRSLKGVPMLEFGSAFGYETPTISFVTLENSEYFGRKAHLGEITAIL